MGKDKIHEKATFLRDAIFGANDGIITTFAIIAGSAGASLPLRAVLILGFANLFADGFSMASGNYLGVKSEKEFEEAENQHTLNDGSPLKHGLVTFISFDLAGLLPIIPFLFTRENGFMYSAVIVVVALFTIGSLRSKYTKKNWILAGTEMLVVGGFAALVAYLVGYGLDKFVM